MLHTLLIALFAITTVRLTAEPSAVVTLDPQKHDAIKQTAILAIKKGDIHTIDSLLQRGLGVNDDSNGESLLYLAVSEKQPAIVRLLIAHGADVNRPTSSQDFPVNRACWLGDKKMADLLVQHGAHANPILYATATGDLATLRDLYTKHPLNAHDTRGALHFANASGHPNTFDWLWTRLAPMTPAEKEALLSGLYQDAVTWHQPGMIKHLEKMGAKPR